MAVQSLYRRYRPQRFGELRGQDHVVRALRNAVMAQREGQAYLFSGPRGTGKTSSARILAKVLNCESSVDGEPCCVCDSCKAVESGTSYDVFELDAASNNGVDEIRNLIEKASLGTPGRHKVYILDEVHMLSKGANAALLKTLEEPPPHVVFVLATTDPQKVPETIRSRTQHLQFHLLSIDELEQHVRWVATDAGIDLDDDALRSVLDQGAGSARDALSALELVAISGGSVEVAARLDDLLDALADQDTGLALATIAHAVQNGRDARSLSDEAMGVLREAFLTLMAPELVQVPTARADTIADQARRVGAPLLVRAMEVLGEVLIEMRHAPDPRLLLEVALVKLTNNEIDPGVSSLLARVKHLEDLVAKGFTAAPERTLPVDPATGRAQLGSRARTDSPPAAPSSSPPAAEPATPDAAPATDFSGPPPTPSLDQSTAASSPPTSDQPPPQPTASEPPPTESPVRHGDVQQAIDRWPQLVPELTPMMVRALYAASDVVGERDGRMVVSVPNEPHRQRAEQYRAAVERALAAVAGGPVRIELVIANDHPAAGFAPAGQASVADKAGPASAAAPAAPTPAAADDDDFDGDLDGLTDAPPEGAQTDVDRLAKVFPGLQLIEEPD